MWTGTPFRINETLPRTTGNDAFHKDKRARGLPPPGPPLSVNPIHFRGRAAPDFLPIRSQGSGLTPRPNDQATFGIPTCLALCILQTPQTDEHSIGGRPDTSAERNSNSYQPGHAISSHSSYTHFDGSKGSPCDPLDAACTQKVLPAVAGSDFAAIRKRPWDPRCSDVVRQ